MRDPKDITINGKQLSEILELHKTWLLDNAKGERADLSYAKLRYANLSYANLSYANLNDANLSYADLSYADLSYVNMSCADLRYANLSYANLHYADLSYVNMSCADLRYAKNNELAVAMVTIVLEGDIVGWKKCREGIVKLLIPAGAKRSNATGRKCRAEFAVDQAHYKFSGEETTDVFTSQHEPNFCYIVGKTLTPDSWDDDRWKECSSGIHFFITRAEAEAYR